ncbi:MAG TPA: 4-(cytidine 5'-diphospho)-2-C-methyl-D-erythritol kinase [Candidatus Binatia bacterium]|nr:4-(cytidine 5'-diphospho)-2-C-methyl-D-erythritol kinase [Candidatus Binatia bacterium]
MRGVTIQAPAKVNLSLRIVGRRPDGYHLLDSLMVPVSLCDALTITVSGGRPELVVTCDDPAVPGGETNLAYKAAALLRGETGVRTKIAVALRKQIPAGAGLGGGSSDAAAVLKGLNALLSLRLSEDQLCPLAARLGADVPFFIPCRPAKVAGVGEILTAVPPLPSRWLVIVVPPFGVSTPWAYRRFDELPSVATPPADVPRQRPAHQWDAALLVNDLERAVLPEYPQIDRIKAQLLHIGAEGALMSGSGSAVFGVFHSRARAEQAMRAVADRGKTFLATPLAGPPETA